MYIDNPFMMVVILFSLSAVGLGLAIRIYERPYYDDYGLDPVLPESGNH